ncbi:hypothetical protein HanPSC8_Chr03g0133681 [Helianthus annuus]|nr:hypothetical protein HanPSC8_Chr03g0133681 [Helianthus annuus]
MMFINYVIKLQKGCNLICMMFSTNYLDLLILFLLSMFPIILISRVILILNLGSTIYTHTYAVSNL